MRLIIDRFEGGFAVCETENKKMVNIERRKLPHDAKVGDVIIRTAERYIIDKNETDRRRDRIKKLMDDIWE